MWHLSNCHDSIPRVTVNYPSSLNAGVQHPSSEQTRRCSCWNVWCICSAVQHHHSSLLVKLQITFFHRYWQKEAMSAMQRLQIVLECWTQSPGSSTRRSTRKILRRWRCPVVNNWKAPRWTNCTRECENGRWFNLFTLFRIRFNFGTVNAKHLYEQIKSYLYIYIYRYDSFS